MSDVETLKAELKKLSARATFAKMELHDLSEELPANWESIMQVAQKTYDTFSELQSKRAQLSALEAVS